MIVYKYALNKSGVTGIHLPLNAKVLCVGLQMLETESPFLWVLVDPKMEFSHYREFLLVSTGQEIEGEIIAYIGTVFPENAKGVFHIFEVKP